MSIKEYNDTVNKLIQIAYDTLTLDDCITINQNQDIGFIIEDGHIVGGEITTI